MDFTFELTFAAIAVVVVLLWCTFWWIIFGKAGFNGGARAVAFVPMLELVFRTATSGVLGAVGGVGFLVASVLISAIIAMIPAIYLAFARWPAGPHTPSVS